VQAEDLTLPCDREAVAVLDQRSEIALQPAEGREEFLSGISDEHLVAKSTFSDPSQDPGYFRYPV
jgi:hypothetical protein